MKKLAYLFALLAGASMALPSASAQGLLHKHKLPPCEPGFKWVEVTEMKEVCRYECRLVPDVKKTSKWVYSCVDDPFCIHKTPCHHHQCDGACPTCKGPYCRKQLVKREVVCEEPTTKCVVEKIVDVVPCKVWRKVPCGTEVSGVEQTSPVTQPAVLGAPGAVPATIPVSALAPAKR